MNVSGKNQQPAYHSLVGKEFYQRFNSFDPAEVSKDGD
jgi:hypothetical protein